MNNKELRNDPLLIVYQQVLIAAIDQLNHIDSTIKHGKYPRNVHYLSDRLNVFLNESSKMFGYDSPLHDRIFNISQCLIHFKVYSATNDQLQYTKALKSSIISFLNNVGLSYANR